MFFVNFKSVEYSQQSRFFLHSLSLTFCNFGGILQV
uniref:Uncharacterized protein n=1 Tax=Siphoviridae sp. ctDmQ3 TaxID=2823570 RepID=A0A8S5L846_9CAUD|nr:MAG TPA: hypothetical protein [Siphoviridae sp. ctDmQ3]